MSKSFTGYEISQGLGKNFTRLVFPDDLAKTHESHIQTLNGKPQSYVVRIKDSKAKIKTISVNASPLRKNGIITGVLGFGRDITRP